MLLILKFVKNVKVNMVMRQHNIWCVYVRSVWRCVPPLCFVSIYSVDHTGSILSFSKSDQSVKCPFHSGKQPASQPVGQSVGHCCWPKTTMSKLELCCVPLPVWKLNERSGIVVGGQTSASEPLSIVTLFASKWWPLPSFPVAPIYLYGIALIK